MNIINIIDTAIVKYGHETPVLTFLPENRYNTGVFKITGQYDWFSEQVLYFLIRYIQPCRIFEISTASGYATMFMALALKQNNLGRIDTYEIDARVAQSAEQLFAEHGLNKYVNLICEDARKTSVRSPSDYSIYFLDSIHTEEFARWFIEQHVMRSERIDAIFHMHNVLPLSARVRRWNGPPFEGTNMDPYRRIGHTKRFKYQICKLLQLRPQGIEDNVQIQTYPPENGEELHTFDGNSTTEALWGNKLVTMMAEDDY
jgi:predicted O-methyltransferase YrrM